MSHSEYMGVLGGVQPEEFFTPPVRRLSLRNVLFRPKQSSVETVNPHDVSGDPDTLRILGRSRIEGDLGSIIAAAASRMSEAALPDPAEKAE